LGVVADFEPTWAELTSYERQMDAPRLGSTRFNWLYPMKSVSDAGGVLAFGTDWWLYDINPMFGVEVAVTRQVPGTPGVLTPAERLDLPTSVKSYTYGVSYANFTEGQTGTIAPGKKANLVVLSANIFSGSVYDIHSVAVLMTLFK